MSSLEEITTTLKGLIKTFEEFSDEEKLEHTEMYNEIMLLKEKCEKLLHDYKIKVQFLDNLHVTNGTDDDNTAVDSEEFNKTVQELTKIKKTNFSNMNIEELANLCKSVRDHKNVINSYLNKKRMEVVYL